MIVSPRVLAAIRQPVFVYRREGIVEAANDRAEALAGAPLAGMTPADVIACLSVRHRDGTPLLPNELPTVRALRGEEVVDVPFTVTAADGRTVRVLATASPIVDGDTVAGALSVWQDVTALARAEGELAARSAAQERQNEELAVQGEELQMQNEELRVQTAELREQGAALRQSEALLAAERQRLFDVLETLPVMVCLLTPDRHVAFANRAFREKFGESEGRHCYEYCCGFTGPCPFCEAFVPLETGRPHHWEFTSPDGSTIIDVYDFPFADLDGSPLILEMDLDITERARAEAALRESEERQAFLLALNDALAPLADPAEVQAAAARVLAEHLGADRVAYFEVDGDDYVVDRDYARSVPSIAGRNPIARFGPRVIADYRAGRTAISDDLGADPDLSAGEKANFAAVQVGAYIGVPMVKAGVLVAGLAVHTASPRPWTQAEVALVEETAGRTWAAVERARAEGRLRASEGRFRSVLDHSLDALYRLDLRTGRYAYASPAFERILGRTPGEMTSQDTDETMTWIHLDDRAAVAAGLARVEETGAAEIDFRVRDPDGRYRWISNHLSLVRDGTGRPLYRDGVVRDVTVQNEAEAALRQNAENLRRSNEDLERFAYVASHDLQEPLRSIVSFTQLLDRRYRGKLDAEADEYIDFIVEGGNRMQGLILDLLAFSRVNTTRQQIARTDAEDVLAGTVRNLEGSLREAGATLTHDPLPVVMADPTQLAQVFANLVSNALKFRRPDAPLLIRVGARRTDGFWEFSVADNGIGIEPEYFEKIFVIFQRLHTREVYPGTGIGLAIVKRIVDRHGGRMRVESTPGEGTTFFFFTLPAA